MRVASRREQRHTVLVVDDEPNIRELLREGLELNGFAVRSAANGTSAIEEVADGPPDIVVLDVSLPDVHGFEVARRLHALREGLPVVFLTARDAVGDRIAGLTAGGDDYLAKPFSLTELVLRLRAVLRRAGTAVPHGVLRCADLVVDEDAMQVRRGDQDVLLSPTEFRLLTYLVRNAGLVLTKRQLLERVWDGGVDTDSRVVDSYISYLRRKVDSSGEPLIHTLRGVGYSLREPSGRG